MTFIRTVCKNTSRVKHGRRGVCVCTWKRFQCKLNARILLGTDWPWTAWSKKLELGFELNLPKLKQKDLTAEQAVHEWGGGRGVERERERATTSQIKLTDLDSFGRETGIRHLRWFLPKAHTHKSPPLACRRRRMFVNWRPYAKSAVTHF